MDLDVLGLVKEVGPLVAAVVFFIWRDWKREERMTTRISDLEDNQQKVILPLVEKCTTVIAQNTEVMQRLERGITEFNCPYKTEPGPCSQRPKD